MTERDGRREPEPSPGAGDSRVRWGGRIVTVLLGLGAVAFTGFALWRLVVSGLLGIDGNGLTTAGLALSPYVALGGLLLAALTALLRRYRMASVVALLSAALVAVVLPRAFAEEQPEVDGPALRVLALNMYFGEADADAIVRLVREQRVDVLTLVELGTEGAEALERAGLRDALPHQLFEPGDLAVGSGIASRYPLEELDLTGPSWFEQPSARVRVGEGVAVEVVAVHPIPPVTRSGDWRSELRGLPGAEPAGPPRILAGDFNATLDHAELHRLLDTGYVDAADALGEGLSATWPLLREWPPVTLDHVLVDRRAAVTEFRTFEVQGTDHRAVLAAARLP